MLAWGRSAEIYLGKKLSLSSYGRETSLGKYISLLRNYCFGVKFTSEKIFVLLQNYIQVLRPDVCEDILV